MGKFYFLRGVHNYVYQEIWEGSVVIHPARENEKWDKGKCHYTSHPQSHPFPKLEFCMLQGRDGAEDACNIPPLSHEGTYGRQHRLSVNNLCQKLFATTTAQEGN